MVSRRISSSDGFSTIVNAITRLQDQGYKAAEIAKKTGLDEGYIRNIATLLRQGEERLIAAVEKGYLPLRTACDIAKSSDDEIQKILMRAFDEDELLRARSHRRHNHW